MKIFKLSKGFPLTIYRDENLYYVWIYHKDKSFGDLMCTSIYAIAYVVSYIEARKYRKMTGGYFHPIFKGPSLKHCGYWGKSLEGEKFEFTKFAI